METFQLFQLWFHQAYDSAYNSDFSFLLGPKLSYDSDYNSNSDSDYDSDTDSVPSENQP